MPRTGNPEAVLVNILNTLESKTSGSQDRCDAYEKLSWTLTESEVKFVQEVSKNIKRLLKVIKEDVAAGSNDVKKKALQLLGTCIFDTEIVSHMGKTKCVEMLDILLHTIINTKEKSICSIALWCLKSQNIDQNIVIDKAEQILMTVESAMEKWSTTSVSVVDGFVGTIERLNSQAPKEMRSSAFRWGKLLIPLVVNKAVQVRESALTVIENNMDSLKSVQKDLVIALKSVVKQKILPGLKELFKENWKVSVYVLRCWGTLVQFYGQELHNVSYINEFMAVVELGFKSAEPPIKIAAFKAWRQLIDNFALNKSVIQDPKKINLIMQVFKHNNTKTESVALEKLACWWHFLWLLGDKVSPNFELVADPLLNFCVGGKLQKHSGGPTPRSLVHSGTQPTFKSLQLLGCEALAHFLGNVEEGRELSHKFKLDPFTHRIVTGPAFYIKHAEVLITTASLLCTSLGKDTPESLALHSWEWLIAHLKTAIDNPGKLDIRKTLSTLLLEFRVVVQGSTLPNNILLVMFERFGTIQKRVLCSGAYSIQGEEMINGTPALFITRLLLSPTLLMACSGLDSFHDTFSFLLENGSGNSMGTLGFLQSVLEILKENAQYVDCKENIWRLWSAVEHLLTQHITKTNEINQGDSLEHDFGCSVQVLVFPVLQDLHELPQSLVKSLVKSWSELYKTVNRLAALVTNAEANIVCEETCSQMLDHYLEKDTVEVTEVDMLVQMCRVIISSLYFSSIGSEAVFKMSVSPKKFTKNRHKPLENIHSVIALVGLLQKRTLTLVPDWELTKKSTGVSLQLVLNNLVETFSTIFGHVTSSNVIFNLIGQLAHPVGELFADSQKKTVKLYSNAFQSKLEKLWMDICTCLQSRYTSVFDSDFLEKCSPLLEGTFLHPRRQIKNQTMSLWSCTFGKAAYLRYPESLKPILSKVKAKTMIELPNWVATISAVVDETPVSQMTQIQAPEPHIPGMPSPHKIHGSFLNKAVSPNLKSSPARKPVSPVSMAATKKKKLNLDGFDDKDFVLIKPTPKKKMVLTEHQKEVLKEKSTLPAMYNSLEHSVDASLMAAHFTTDTQMDGSLSETPTPTTEPLSLFGSVIPPTNQGDVDAKGNAGNKRPVDKTQENKKAVRKAMNSQSQEKSLDSGTVSESGQRQSVRVQDQDESSESNWTKFQNKKEGTITDERVKQGGEKSSGINTQSSCIIIDDDMPTDGVFGIEDDQTPSEFDFDMEDDSDIIESLSEQNFEGKLSQMETEETNKNASAMNGSSGKTSGNNCNRKDAGSGYTEKDLESNVPKSASQNISGAFDLFKSLSSIVKDNQRQSKDEIASTDTESDLGDGRTVVSKDDNLDQEKAISQPLHSWTQKLNELSSSPRNVSPLRKWSSQDTALSPGKKNRASKSPKRNKKKPADENEEKGTLDKWVIHTPSKTLQGNVNTEVVVANLSQTLVEETQSPTKFANGHMKADKISSSIMETPPKNVLENITGSHSNSNRKLFPSQPGNPEFVEDSNIVPASPNSKSFRCGTPVLKLKKLTSEEIKRYSPSRRRIDRTTEENLSETLEKTKRAIQSFERTKQEIETATEAMSSDSLHEHDDFSVFTPLETGGKDTKCDDFFSNSLTDTDRAMLNVREKNKTDSVELCSGSENLFTQSERVNEAGNSEFTSETCAFSMGQADETEKKGNSESQIISSENVERSREMNTIGNSEGNETSKDLIVAGKDAVQMSQMSGTESGNCGRGRKRKQVAPKKLTPEEIKQKKKKDEEVSRIVAKGLYKKPKEQKQQGGTKEETQRKKQKKEKLPKAKQSQERRIKKEKKGNKESERFPSNAFGREKGKMAQLDTSSGGSSTYTSSEENTDSSHEELEVTVLEDMLDLEEDLHTVKTLTQIKKELKKSKVVNQSSQPDPASVVFGNVIPKNIEKNIAVTDKINDNVSQRSVDIIDENENLEKDMHESDHLEYPTESSDVTTIPEEEPCLSIEEAPFIAVKLCDAQFQHSDKHKTDGTVRSPNADGTDLTAGAMDFIDSERNLIESGTVNDKAKDHASMNGSETSQSEAGSENVTNDSFFSDDDVPLAEMKDKVIQKKVEPEKISETAKEAVNCKKKLQPRKTRLRTNAKKTAGSTKGRRIEKKVCTENEMDNDSVSAVSDTKEPNISVSSIESVQQQDSNCKEVPYLDETPRKEVDISKSSAAARLLMSHSDNNLTVGSRKFEKKGGVARRSILKPSQKGLLEQTDSPKRKPFHPITVGRIYSPTASPSASILKGPKRKFSEDDTLESESPPAKQRRVSFATPLTDVTRVDMERPPSPLVKVTGKNLSQESGKLTQSGRFIESQSTPGSPSQKNYESTQESQINTTDPVCPELIGCDESVEKILPQLMASSWSKGLSNLVRARNIHTIGDLSSLTEGDIHNLPIRSPKVHTVKKVLTKFADSNPEVKQLPENLPSKVYQPSSDKGKDEHVDGISNSLLDCDDKIVKNTNKSESQKLMEAQSCDQFECETDDSKPDINMTEALLKFCDTQNIDFKRLSANELVKISQNLTAMLSKVNKAIENVVSTRCSSPWR